nr:MAG TPA: Immunity protein Imm2 [Caudoviricetes sp.]
MAEYNNQSIDIDLEDMFNNLSNEDKEEFLIDMFSNLHDEDSKCNVVNDNMLNLENDSITYIITEAFDRMNSYDKEDIAERIADALTSEQREALVEHIKEG